MRTRSWWKRRGTRAASMQPPPEENETAARRQQYNHGQSDDRNDAPRATMNNNNETDRHDGESFPTALLDMFAVVFDGDLSRPIALEPQRIRMRNGARLPRQRRRTLNREKREATKELLESFVQDGLLRRQGPSEGVMYAAPVHPVRKPGDGGYRLTWDYRALNAALTPEFFPMPFGTRDLQNKIAGCTVFGKADLKKAFWQLLVDRATSQLCAVTVEEDIYLPTRLPQGLSVSAQICQRVITGIFRGDYGTGEENLLECHEGHLLIYIDDILLAAYDEPRHESLWRKVLTRAQKYNCKISKEKSIYKAEQVKYVGRTISAAGISSGYDHGDGLSTLKSPTTEKELHDMVHGFGYYREFLPGLAQTLAPARALLTDLQRQRGTSRAGALRQQRSWGDAKQAELDATTAQLRQLIEEQMTITFPDPAKQLYIMTDASDVGWGGIVGQMDRTAESLSAVPFQDRNPQILGCLSGTWSEAEKKWSTPRQESWAVLHTLKSYDFLEATLDPILCLCDNAATVRLFNASGEKQSQAVAAMQRMAEEFAEFNARTVDFPGKFNLVSDYMSRPRSVPSSAPAQAPESLPTPAPTAAPPPLSGEPNDEHDADDAEEHAEERDDAPLHDEDPDGEVEEELEQQLVAMHERASHSRSTAFRQRCRRRLPNVTPSRMKRAMDRVLRYCTVCQRMDRRHTIYYGEGANELYDTRAACMHLDLKITSDPNVPCIMVLTDHFSAFTWVEGMPSKAASESWAALQRIRARQSRPIIRLFSDHGSEFFGDFERECDEAQIEQLVCAPRSPWMNGRVERMMAEVEKMMMQAWLDDMNLSITDALPQVEELLNQRELPQLLAYTPAEVWQRALDEDWDKIDNDIFVRRQHHQANRQSVTRPRFYRFEVGARVLIAKRFWAARATGDSREAFARAPNWLGPWMIVSVLDEGYSVEVERDYEWRQRSGRGRPLRGRYHMSIRYVKPLHVRESERASLEQWGSDMHATLFGSGDDD